jgi:hypothetical protein
MDVGAGPYCAGCVLRGPCGQADTPRACQPIFGDPRYGGLNVLHFAHDYLDHYFAEVRGPEFGDVRVAPRVAPLDFPLTMPRLYPLSSLQGLLSGRFYAVGADKALFERKEILRADDLREIVDIWGNQGLALMLYGKDPHMEELWRRRHSVVPEIAAAEYDFVSPPSFSARINHPPPEYLFNVKRSLIFFELLQEHGVPTAPRLAFLSEHDVRRAAAWCDEQEALDLITMDLAIKVHGEWQRQLELLRLFDALTGKRLTYLIHGPAAPGRVLAIFAVLGSRVRLTGTRAISRPWQSPSDFAAYARAEEALAYRALMQVESNPAPALACPPAVPGPLHRMMLQESTADLLVA